jgi:hypothetical protein
MTDTYTTQNKGNFSDLVGSSATRMFDIDLFDTKKVRPKVSIANLRGEGIDPAFATEAKVIALIELMAFNWLDQEGRTRRKPLSPGALRVISTKRARRARVTAAAALVDLHTISGAPDKVGAELLNVLLTHGGMRSLVNGSSAGALLRRFKKMDQRLKYVVGITSYLVRCAVHPDKTNPETIGAAKAFVCKWEDDAGLSKIEKIWEDFKLAAPYIYALHLERSFRPHKAERPADVLKWTLAFIKNPARVDRFLGHAAFAMDTLKRHASDQRQSDFRGRTRIVPFVRPFDCEERAFIASFDPSGPLW